MFGLLLVDSVDLRTFCLPAVQQHQSTAALSPLLPVQENATAPKVEDKPAPADISNYLQQTGLAETKLARWLSMLCAQTYFMSKLTVCPSLPGQCCNIKGVLLHHKQAVWLALLTLDAGFHIEPFWPCA